MNEKRGRIAIAASVVWMAMATALILGTHGANVASAESMSGPASQDRSHGLEVRNRSFLQVPLDDPQPVAETKKAS